jgi:hypothetical protein
MIHQSTCVDRSVTKVLRPLCDVEVGPEEELEAPKEQEYGIRTPGSYSIRSSLRARKWKSIVSHTCPTETGVRAASKGRAGQRHTLRIPPERMD